MLRWKRKKFLHERKKSNWIFRIILDRKNRCCSRGNKISFQIFSRRIFFRRGKTQIITLLYLRTRFGGVLKTQWNLIYIKYLHFFLFLRFVFHAEKGSSGVISTPRPSTKNVTILFHFHYKLLYQVPCLFETEA